VGAGQSLDSPEPFALEDGFLRRIVFPNLIKNGVVRRKAFKDNHTTLSFTFRNDELKTSAGLDFYQSRKKLPSGDLPGLCMLTYGDLTLALEPPLEPRHERDTEDEYYGNLHCVTDRPVHDDQRERMAKLATKHKEVLRPVVSGDR